VGIFYEYPKNRALTVDLQAQRDFYTNILELPREPTSSRLLVQTGKTELLFTQASSNFEGAYHFAFNIPENQYLAGKEWDVSGVPYEITR
jgi:catechol-2,3-dioxygenase